MDNQLSELLKKEHERIECTANLIASESYPERDVIEAAGNVFTAKYQMGFPYTRLPSGEIDHAKHSRWYAGTEVYDVVEKLAIAGALKAFRLPEFGVSWASPQPLSGSHANLTVYAALMNPGDHAVGFSCTQGGHPSHGDRSSITGVMYNWKHYGVKANGEIDEEELERLCAEHKPKLLQVGGSSIARGIDFERVREIANRHKIPYVMADIAHVAGLVAARVGVYANESYLPWKWCDVVTTTTHKTLRGISGGLIMVPNDRLLNKHGVTNGDGRTLRITELLETTIVPGTTAKSPGNIMYAKVLTFMRASTPLFQEWSIHVLQNARAMEKTLREHGARVFGDETQNHTVLLETTSFGLTGKEAQDAMEKTGIITNACSIPDQDHEAAAAGVRLGSAALTCRAGWGEESTKILTKLLVETLKFHQNQEETARIRREVRELLANHPTYETKSTLEPAYERVPSRA